MAKRLLVVLSFIIALGASFYVGQLTVDTGYTGDTEITDAVFLEVLEDLYEDHYSQPSVEQLMDGAVNGMIGSLEDPHTTYFDAESFQEYQNNFGESYVGIGVRVLFRDNLIVIEEVFEGSPAEDAGIRPNDIITSVDGTDVTDQDLYDTLLMVVGEEGTEVTIGITRAGVAGEIPFVLTRAVIENSSVVFTTFEQEGQTIGVIEVTQFGNETADKFEEALEDLEALGIDGLVIDLRNNGGGHLFAVLAMLQEFLLDNGRAMFSTEYYSNGEFYRDNYYGVRDNFRDYNIVTLINEGSASASEVFASAMQEHGNYTLVGTVSYGKGTMQIDRVLQSTESDRLHLSIGRWLTADGNWVHFNGGTDGVTPDILVEPTPQELAYKLFLFDGETLEFDQVDPRIENLQYMLQALGYDVRNDGYFDQETKDAIIDLQTTNAQTADGIVDADILSVINDLFDEFQDDPANDSQLHAAIDYLVDNPDHD